MLYHAKMRQLQLFLKNDSYSKFVFIASKPEHLTFITRLNMYKMLSCPPLGSRAEAVNGLTTKNDNNHRYFKLHTEKGIQQIIKHFKQHIKLK